MHMPHTNPESSRMELLRMLDILDSTSEAAFDALVRTASKVCKCPISLISLIDVDRQWFKAKVGLEVDETPRDQAFCAHAIRGDALFEIPDATEDVRFATNPLVTGDTRIRFYAGQPILFEGVALGTLCVIDRVPKHLDAEQRSILEDLAEAAGELLNGRMQAILHRREEERLTAFAHLSGDCLWETDRLDRCTWLSGTGPVANALFSPATLGSRLVDAPIFDPYGRNTGPTTLLGVMANGRRFSNAVVRTEQAGQVRYVAIVAEPLVDDSNGLRGFRGSARDVTKKVQAKQAADSDELTGPAGPASSISGKSFQIGRSFGIRLSERSSTSGPSMSSIVRRSFDILEVLASHPDGRTLSELATELDIPLSATHRLLADLIESGYIRKEARHGDFILTMKLASLGLRFLSAGGVVDVAQPLLDRLAQSCSELVRLTIVDGDDLVFVAKAQGATRGLRYDPDMGQNVTLSCSAAGFAWLATKSDEEVMRLVSRQGFGDPEDFGAKAPTSMKALLAHVRATRKRGFSMTTDIFAPAMSSMAAAVRDARAEVVGILIIAGPMARLTEARMEQLGPTVLQVADEIGLASGVSAMFKRRGPAAPLTNEDRKALRVETPGPAKRPAKR